MRVIIENTSLGAKNVWTAKIDPQQLIKLAKPQRQGGGLSIVMVCQPTYDAENLTLQFDLDSALLLNLGNSHEAILIEDGVTKNKTHQTEIPSTQSIRSNGDKRFFDELKNLPDPQRNIGEMILKTIRQEFPGELVYHPKSGKFVESPDNFWVARVQPRAKSLRIVIYGKPQEHKTYQHIELKNDMMSYSSFVISADNQLAEAIKAIREAKRLKNLR